MIERKTLAPWMGDLMLFITAIVWGGGFIGVVEALDSFSPFYIITIRFAIASVLMLILFWKHVRKIEKKDLLPGVISGLFLFVGFAFQTTGAMYLSVGKLAFLTELSVIMVPFIVWICFKEKIKKYHLISIMIAIVGFAFLNLSKETGFVLGFGELLGIGCAFGFAAQIAILGHFARKIDPIKLAILQMLTCTVLGACCALLFENPPQVVTLDIILPIINLGVFSTFVGFLCQTIGQKYTSASRAAIILSMESVFGISLSIIILKEAVTVPVIIGASLILVAVVIAEYMHAKSEASMRKENISVTEIGFLDK